MTLSKIADLCITLITLFVQVLIARHYFSDWRKRLAPSSARIAGVALCLLWLTFLLAIPFRVEKFNLHMAWVPLWFRGPFLAVGNLWGILSTCSFFIYLAVKSASREERRHSPARRQLIQAAGTVAIAAPFAVAGFGAVIERKNFRIEEVNLPIPNLHPDLEGLRIGQLSDMHVSPWLSPNDLRHAVDMLNECKPHLTLVTGDLITQPGDPLDDAIRELGRLRADAGVLGCMGNHERYCRCERYEQVEAAKYGIDMLRRQNRVLRFGGAALNIAGVDYQSLQNGPYLRNTDNLIVPGTTNLLLSHNPDVFPTAAAQGWDATISGHTHGGQVTVEILNQTLNIARFATRYVSGLYRLNGKTCYVTKGIGTIFLPVRVGAPPEITVLRLKRG